MRQGLHFISIITVLTLSVFFISCGEETTQEVKDCYRLLRVERQDFTLNREIIVKLESKRNINVRPLISGRLTKICVQEGAHVKKGQVLFVVDQAPYKASVDAAKGQVATARATLSTAQLNLEGKEKLYAQQMVGEFDLRRARHAKEEASAQVEAAQAELESAQTNLGYTTITSPVDGVIDMVNYRVGDYVAPDSEVGITLLVDNNYFNAYGSISEEMLSGLLHDFKCRTTNELLSKLPPVTFYSNWGYKLPQEGHIDAISGSVDPLVGATYLRASFNNPSEMLRSGSNGYIVLPYVMHRVIVIPQEAAVDIHDKYFVYKVVNGKAVATEVTIMPYNDGAHFVVTSGLEPGDVIIAEGAGLVEDGIEVTEKKDEKDKKGGKLS